MAWGNVSSPTQTFGNVGSPTSAYDDMLPAYLFTLGDLFTFDYLLFDLYPSTRFSDVTDPLSSWGDV